MWVVALFINIQFQSRILDQFTYLRRRTQRIQKEEDDDGVCANKLKVHKGIVAGYRSGTNLENSIWVFALIHDPEN